MSYKDFLQDDLFIYWRVRPTKELDDFWDEYLQKNVDAKKSFDEAVKIFDGVRDERGKGSFENEQTFQQLRIKIKQMKKQRKVRSFFISSAAAVLLVMLASTLFMLNNKRHDGTEISTIGRVMSENSVQLLAGDNVLELENNCELTLLDNRAIVQDAVARKEVDLEKEQINKLIVPYGKRSSILLADGSKVYLNSGTEMEFPAAFTGKTREIRISGEIFIEVVPNETPFIIHTSHSQINVYGTSFNVSSYSDATSETVVLVSGSIEVKSMGSSSVLQPNEMAKIENGVIQRNEVDVSEYISWKNGYLKLNAAPLNEMLTKIGRYYNKEFTYNTELKLGDRTCSGKLHLSDNFDDVLNAFSKLTELEYEKISGDKVAIGKQK